MHQAGHLNLRSVYQIIQEDRFQIASGSTFCFVDKEMIYSNLTAKQFLNFFIWNVIQITDWQSFTSIFTFILYVKDCFT